MEKLIKEIIFLKFLMVESRSPSPAESDDGYWDQRTKVTAFILFFILFFIEQSFCFSSLPSPTQSQAKKYEVIRLWLEDSTCQAPMEMRKIALGGKRKTL